MWVTSQKFLKSAWKLSLLLKAHVGHSWKGTAISLCLLSGSMYGERREEERYWTPLKCAQLCLFWLLSTLDLKWGKLKWEISKGRCVTALQQTRQGSGRRCMHFSLIFCPRFVFLLQSLAFCPVLSFSVSISALFRALTETLSFLLKKLSSPPPPACCILQHSKVDRLVESNNGFQLCWGPKTQHTVHLMVTNHSMVRGGRCWMKAVQVVCVALRTFHFSSLYSNPMNAIIPTLWPQELMWKHGWCVEPAL